MRFWDSSAIVPLCIREGTSEGALREIEVDPLMVVWWTTATECASALARRERDGVASSSVDEALERLGALAMSWTEVQPVDRVRQVAGRLLRVHPLRAADALQLAAALVASNEDPAALPFVTLDDRLTAAARREGFRVLVPQG